MEPQHRISYWERTTFLAPADVIVVGSGIVGLNAAIALKEASPNLKVTILERGSIPIGASTRNAGFACFGSISEVVSDVESIGYDRAVDLIQLRKKGLDTLLNRVGTDNVDFMHQGGSEVFLNGEEHKFENCALHIDRLNADLRTTFGDTPYARVDEQRIKLPGVSHLVGHPNEGQLHPGKLVATLQKIAGLHGIRILTGVHVESLDENDNEVVLTAKRLKMTAKCVVVATNGFARQLLSELDIRSARNQVLMTEPLGKMPVRGCFHYNEGYVYFRDVGDRLLIGGARHIAMEQETTDRFDITDDIMVWLADFVRAHLIPRDVKFEFQWSGILGIGDSKEPIIKKVSNRIVVGVRLGGMGVAIGALVGETAAKNALDIV